MKIISGRRKNRKYLKFQETSLSQDFPQVYGKEIKEEVSRLLPTDFFRSRTTLVRQLQMTRKSKRYSNLIGYLSDVYII